jgi:DNA-binding response OmpR family regulator
MAKETILVVDDSPEIVHFLKQYVLVPAGYTVLTAADGQSGLDMAVNHNPDLIMLDMSMPRMNGLQMLVALRRTSCQAPVIFMTLHGSESIAVEVFRLGVRDYMVKPFTVDEVKQAIDRALQETRLAREKEELSREVIVADTVRRTVITLSHYLNNSLMVVQAGLTLVQEAITKREFNYNLLPQVITDSLASLKQIGAVMRVLQKITRVEYTNYQGPIKMLDIEAALKDELKQD